MSDATADGVESPVLGGALTRDPRGELYTMQTLGASWVPIVTQQLWSDIRRKRYPKAWQGWEPRPDMYVIWWRGPVAIVCGNCGTEIVSLETYHAGREFGMIMDTSSKAADPSYRRPKPGLNYWLDGHIGGRPGRTSASFSCPRSGCHKKYLRRNFRKLAKELYEANGARYELR